MKRLNSIGVYKIQYRVKLLEKQGECFREKEIGFCEMEGDEIRLRYTIGDAKVVVSLGEKQAGLFHDDEKMSIKF